MFCTLWQTYTHKLPQAHTHRLVHYRANSKVQICKLILKSLSDLRLADTVLSLNLSCVLDLLCVQLQHCSFTRLPTSLIHHYRGSTWLRDCHSALKSDPTYTAARLIAQLCAVYKCAQTWFPQSLIYSFFLFIEFQFFPLCTQRALTVHAHTATVVCICKDIFKQSQWRIYTRW